MLKSYEINSIILSDKFQSSPTTPSMPRVIAVTGGKGGVGKTLTTANLGLCFRRLGMRTLMIDTDLGLANLDIILSLCPEYSLDDVLTGTKRLEDIIVTGPEGVRVIPAASGVQKVLDLTHTQKFTFMDQLDSLQEEFDIVLIDTAAGVSKNVQHWVASSNEVIVIATPEPTSLSDAYATIKILSESGAETDFKLIVNMAQNEEEGLKVFEKLASVSEQFLQTKIHYLGHIPFDKTVRNSVKERVPFVLRYPFCESSRSIRSIAAQLISESPHTEMKGTMQFFWKKMMYSQGLAQL